MDKYNYIIFHKGCLDGFSSFIVLNTTDKIAKNAKIYLDIPSTDYVPPEIDGKNIIIMDVAYKKEILEKIFTYANHVTFIDHHITTKKYIYDLEKNHKNITIVFDLEKSGASLTWKYFYKKEKTPLFIKYIEDNDTGKWLMKYTYQFIAGLRVKYNMDIKEDTINKWKNLLTDKKMVLSIIKKGNIYYEYINYSIDMNSKRYTLHLFPSKKIYDKYISENIFKKIGQYKVAVYCGNGCPDGSILAVKMLETINCDFIIMWTYQIDKKKFVMSFRSKYVDVEKIASLFNGGGHKLASAGSFYKYQYDITDLFLDKSLPRDI